MALRRSDRDLSALSVLGLLLSGPRHTFAIYQTLKNKQMNFLTGLPRALYHAVDRLERCELVQAVSNERPGVRPERTIFAITAAGRVDLTGRVRRLLEHPEPDADLFVAALSFSDSLTASQARAALEVRHDELERRLFNRRSTRTAVSKMLCVGADYEIMRLNAERVWVAQLIGELDLGRLHELWPQNEDVSPHPRATPRK
jgi:DNA-binding PadR family transcriptional regulator